MLQYSQSSMHAACIFLKEARMSRALDAIVMKCCECISRYKLSDNGSSTSTQIAPLWYALYVHVCACVPVSLMEF